MRKSQASPPVNTLIFMGMTAPPSKAALMEREIHSVPNDIVTRTKLLGYEYVHQFSTPVAAKKFDNLALWFIARHPGLHISGSPYLVIDKNRAPAAYAQGSRLWKQAVHKQPRDVNVLANAAAFFTSYDSQEAALLLMQASYLDPKSVTLHNKLGTLYALRAERYPASSHVDAVLALAELQRAQDLSHDPTEQYEKLQPLAFMAMEAGNTALATRYARRMLHPTLGTPGVFPVGNSLHDAYIILGRVALKQNNALQAEAYLMAASQVPLSPDLKNFGPNMSLARDFLLRGKPKPVLRYFEACELFWHDQRLALWKTMIQSGKIPKFGPNLWY